MLEFWISKWKLKLRMIEMKTKEREGLDSRREERGD